ncbi:hypothetical protein ACRRTK_013716 [Alexandromys fortis]
MCKRNEDVRGGTHGDLEELAPSPAPRAPPHASSSVSGPPARARPPWKTGKRPFPRARLPEDRRKGPRKGAAGSSAVGIPQLATPQPPASFPRPGPAPEKKEPLQGLPRRHSPKETEGQPETRRTGLRLAGATDAQPGTAAPGTTRKGSPPTRKQPRAPQKEKAQRAPAAITLASTPPAPIYSPLRTPRDLPSLAPARNPTSDVTQPQAGRARLAG